MTSHNHSNNGNGDDKRPLSRGEFFWTVLIIVSYLTILYMCQGYGGGAP